MAPMASVLAVEAVVSRAAMAVDVDVDDNVDAGEALSLLEGGGGVTAALGASVGEETAAAF